MHGAFPTVYTNQYSTAVPLDNRLIKSKVSFKLSKIPQKKPLLCRESKEDKTSTVSNSNLLTSLNQIEGRVKRRLKVDEEEEEQQHSKERQFVSEVSLFLAAILWGTNPVCLRYIYRLREHPSPSFLAASQAIGAFLVLALIERLQKGMFKPSLDRQTRDAPFASEENEEASGKLLNETTRAGLEIGLWTFLANAATISAFQQTTASRGAFLLRLTAVFTPAVTWLSGRAVSGREWTASGIALLGGILISVEAAGQSSSDAADTAFGAGDVLMVVSALLWAWQTVRLGRYAAQHQPLQLAARQTASLAALSCCWLAGSWLLRPAAGQPLMGSLLAEQPGPLTWAALLWPAVGPWGIATALQIILATDPLWATAFATLLGGAEQSLGQLGWLGAACILGASAFSRH